MENSITPTNFEANQKENQKQNNSRTKYFVVAGAVAVFLLIVVIVAILVANNTSKQANGEGLDNIDGKDIASNEIQFTETDDYTKTLNIYNSIDNGMTLDNLKKIVSEAGEGESSINIGAELSNVTVESGEYITFELEENEDSGTQIIVNLTYHNLNYNFEETIQQIEDSKFQHFTNIFTNDFDTKEEAIDDFLMRH